MFVKTNEFHHVRHPCLSLFHSQILLQKETNLDTCQSVLMGTTPHLYDSPRSVALNLFLHF